jgi:hypothetical protein
VAAAASQQPAAPRVTDMHRPRVQQ